MSICYYCHWGWPKPIAEIYKKYAAIAGMWAMHYGPANIIWEDENFERHYIQYCLDNYTLYGNNPHTKLPQYTEEQITIMNEAVKQSLIDMLALSDEILNAIPEEYDNMNPENFPPKMEFERVNIWDYSEVNGGL